MEDRELFIKDQNMASPLHLNPKFFRAMLEADHELWLIGVEGLDGIQAYCAF